MNTLRILLWIVLTSLFLPNAYGQGWERVYTDLFPGSEAAVVKALPVSGGGFLLLVDDATFNSPDHIKIVSIDADGMVIAEFEMPFPTQVTATDLIATSDGGYALLYYGAVPQTNMLSTKLLKLDALFAVLYERDLQQLDPGFSFFGRQLVESSAGLCVVGRIADPVTNHGFIAAYDLAGNLLNYTNWGLPVAMSVGAASISSDGGLIVVGQGFDGATFNASGIVAARFNADGTQMIWEQVIYEQSIAQIAHAVTLAPDGGYLIAGSKSNKGYLTKLDEQGTVLWAQHYPSVPGLPNGVSGFYRIAPTADGLGYWAVSPSSYIQQVAQPILLRLDLQGNILFYRSLGPNLNYYFGKALLALPDGGCLAGGSRSPNLSMNTAAFPFVVRVDSLGNGFLSGISGTATGDTDDDCISDVDSLLEGFRVHAYSNGAYVRTASVGPQGAYFMPLDTGNYQLAVERPNILWSFCPDTIVVTVLAQDTTSDVDFTGFYNVQPIDSLYGYVFEDYDGDCIKDDFEPGYPNWTISAILFNQSTSLYDTTTNSSGYFVIPYPVDITNEHHGQFSISPPSNDGLDCVLACQDDVNISFGDSTTFQAMFGLHCDTLPPCPVMEVDIATIGLRPCRESKVYAKYCNNGSVMAEAAEMVVTIDSALTVLSSSVPWDAVNGNAYTFLLGNLLPEECGTVTLIVAVPCDDPVGLTYCFEAQAYPDTLCQDPDPDWDGSEIEVSADCVGDSVVFTIRNVGMEDMTQAQEYIVIEDNVLLMQTPGQFQLDVGELLTISFPATGAFYRLEAEQVPGFPGLSTPVAWAEGCNNSGGTVSLGFVNQYPLPDDDPWLDVFCLESVNSYDPNDKNGFPRGYASEHFIEENTDIEYLIRFQNTGTAPALDVEIRDSIPVQYLNPLTVRPGASSHPYSWDMQGDGVVVFRFPDINLVDSTTSQKLSQGFVKFRVSQHPKLAAGTEIRNTAAIYFDNNVPVLTNRTVHTIGHDFVQVGTQQLFSPTIRMVIAPNPMSRWVQVRAEGLARYTNLRFRLLNQLGQLALEQYPGGAAFGFDASLLPQGIYFYELWEEGQLVVTGKLVK